jgi:hypothetical protein
MIQLVIGSRITWIRILAFIIEKLSERQVYCTNSYRYGVG